MDPQVRDEKAGRAVGDLQVSEGGDLPVGEGGFRIGENDFELDGRPVRLLSGALHYFRVHEDQWAHRLDMLRAMGLNCVETYVPWNLHEPLPASYRDVGRR